MLRIAVLEKESVAKDIIFEMAKVLQKHTWTFAHFTKISEFAKADAITHFDIVFFNEMFENPRISTTFVEHTPKRIVIYCTSQLRKAKQDVSIVSRILYLDRSHVKKELERLQMNLEALLRSHEEYLLSYNNIHIALKMQDIFYIEKEDRNLIYHTSRGEFQERKTMSEAELYFHTFDFLRIHVSYLVNVRYITRINNDIIELSNHEQLPISRSHKKAVVAWFREYAKH